MPDHNQRAAENVNDTPGMAFSQIPYIPADSALSKSTSRMRLLVVSAFVAASVIGMVAAYLFLPTNHDDPNAPRVVAEVSGMHCPIQCGLRVSAALERLPFVLPGTVTANPKTGVVTFAVTGGEAVAEDQIRLAIEKAGFGVRSVKTPDAVSHQDRRDARTAHYE